MSYPYIKAKSISYGGTRTLASVLYIGIHNTGVKGDLAENNAKYFKNSNTRAAGAHFFVDRKGNVVQSIALSRAAYAVGGFFTQKNGAGTYYRKCTNTNSVSIELCDIVDKYPSEAQVKATRELVKFIQGKCPNAKTIIRHWDVNGKTCPAIMAGQGNASWKKFRAEIMQTAEKPTASTTEKKTYPGTFPILPNRGYFKNGDTGAQVIFLQKFLNWYGKYGLAADGSYGPKTEMAVKKYQKSEGLRVDGYFGKASLAKAKAVKK